MLGMHLNLNIHVIIILRNVERPYDILLRRVLKNECCPYFLIKILGFHSK